jgi:Na+/H+-translocating membrane pyrophosphatase
MKLTKSALKNAFAGSLLLGVSYAANANAKSIAAGIGEGSAIITALILVLIAASTLAGLYFCFVGGKGMFIKEEGSQVTPVQNLGKLAGGLFLVMLMWFISQVSTDFTGETGQNSTSRFESTQTQTPAAGD